MAEDDEYELLPHSSLDKLKQDLDNLKTKGLSGGLDRETTQSINELKNSIDKLMQLFTVAAEDMKKEEAETAGVEKRLGPLIQKVDTLIEQNQELAKGLVVVADMINEHIPRIEEKISQLKNSAPPRPIVKEVKKVQPQPNFTSQQSFNERPSFDFNQPRPQFNETRSMDDFGGLPPLPMQQKPQQPPQPRQPSPPSGLPPLDNNFDFGDIPGAPSPLSGLDERSKKKSGGLLGGLFGKK